VRPEERSLALGIQSIIIRLVGSIPGPVLFGFVVDKVCLLWEPGCGEFSLFAGSMKTLKRKKMSSLNL
jgi:hypothetical protein